MVNVFRVVRATDRAHPALLRQKLLNLALPDPVPVPQVILPRAPIQPLLCLHTPLVVTRLAIAAEATFAGAVPGKLRKGFDRLAVGAVTVTRRNDTGLLHLPPQFLRYPLGVTGMSVLYR
jgi:hypothetical protein